MKNALLCAAIMILGSRLAAAQAQYRVLYEFGSAFSGDASDPNAGLIFDGKGNIYGTSQGGGLYGNYGAVFQLSPQTDGGWTETVIWSFCREHNPCHLDGAAPAAGLVLGGGKLYGTTTGGGTGGLGTAFELSPPSEKGGAWTKSTIWDFCASGGNCPNDGAQPQSKLIRDSAGNLYGTTEFGGPYNAGTVFELSPGSSSSWTETILYSFQGPPSDGEGPLAGVAFDALGNLYGTTAYGGGTKCRGGGCGTVFRLSPNSNGTWSEGIIATGGDQLVTPYSDLSFDKDGNIDLTVSGLTNATPGGVMKLNRETGWTATSYIFNGEDGEYPEAGVILEAGALYGTTLFGGTHNWGTVFKIAKGTETVLYSFCQQFDCTDGASPGPGGFLLADHAGHLFGTAGIGASGGGVVFEITP